MIMSFKVLKYFSSGKISFFLFACQYGKIVFKLINTNFLQEKKNTFFNKQPSCQGRNTKNDLKVKQLAKQPRRLKTLMQNILVGPWVKNFTFSILSLRKLNFSTTFFDTT